MINRYLITLLLCALPFMSYAKMVKVKSGTGFFVNSKYIITNHHVVDSCREIYVQGDSSLHYSFPFSKVKFIGADIKKDIALLKTNEPYRKVSTLRRNSEVNVGDDMMVIGYPGDRALSNEYKVVYGKITNINGIFGKEKAIEFTDSVRQGNSGGPLFDAAGNVIGVVVGLKEYYTYDILNPQNKKFTSRSGVAIPLVDLKNFLNRYRVSYGMNYTLSGMSKSSVENKARKMIVSIKCIQ